MRQASQTLQIKEERIITRDGHSDRSRGRIHYRRHTILKKIEPYSTALENQAKKRVCDLHRYLSRDKPVGPEPTKPRGR